MEGLGYGPPPTPFLFLKLRSQILSSKVFKIYFKKKSVFSCIHLAYLISCQDIPALLNHYLYAKAADSAVNLRINFQNIFAFTVKKSFTIITVFAIFEFEVVNIHYFLSRSSHV